MAVAGARLGRDLPDECEVRAVQGGRSMKPLPIGQPGPGGESAHALPLHPQRLQPPQGFQQNTNSRSKLYRTAWRIENKLGGEVGGCAPDLLALPLKDNNWSTEEQKRLSQYARFEAVHVDLHEVKQAGS